MWEFNHPCPRTNFINRRRASGEITMTKTATKGSDLYVRLLAMRSESGSLVYKRLQLCNSLLSDHEWVESQEGGGGDEGKAIDRLESECFGDLCGLMSLPQLLEVIRAIPSEA